MASEKDDLLAKARKMIEELKERPNDFDLMTSIGDTFARAEEDQQARKYYEKAWAACGQSNYTIKVKMDDLRIREFRRKLRALDQARWELLDQCNRFELEVYTERAAQYPNDLVIRYELGLRQFRCRQLEKAIESLRLSTREPKQKVLSLNMMGKCFFNLKRYPEAVAQFQAALDSYGSAQRKDDGMWRELRHNLQLAKEAME